MRLGELAIKLLCSGACVVALFAATTQALSNRAIRAGSPDAAYSMRPDSPRAAIGLAAIEIERGNYPLAQSLARKALGSGPARPESGTVLALAAQQSGNPALATGVMAQVGLLGWRHPAAQLWLLQAASAQDNLPVAILRAEALLRQDQYPREMMAVLRAASTSEAGRELIVERLATNPGWRERYLANLDDLTQTNVRSHAELLKSLQRTDSPPTRAEAAAFINRLVKRDDFAAAFEFWQALTDGAETAGSLFLQGDRERSYFDWQVKQVPGLNVTLAADSGEAKLADLSLEATGSVGGLVLERLTVLPPGRYIFRSSMEFGGDAPRDFARWRVACAQGNDSLALAPMILAPSRAPAVAQVPVIVPSSCPAQRISLWIDHDRVGTATARVLDASLTTP